MSYSFSRDRLILHARLIFAARPFASRVVAGETSSALRSETAADLNEVVGHNSKTDPPLHTFEPSIPTAIQSVASLQHANAAFASGPPALPGSEPTPRIDRKSTRLNSSHANISYAVFCLKKKNWNY